MTYKTTNATIYTQSGLMKNETYTFTMPAVNVTVVSQGIK